MNTLTRRDVRKLWRKHHSGDQRWADPVECHFEWSSLAERVLDSKKLQPRNYVADEGLQRIYRPLPGAPEKAVELINRRLTEWVRGPKDQSTFARDVMTILNDLKLRVHA